MLREKVAPARSRDTGNTVLSKEFPGGILVMTGANTAVGLRSMPVRYLFLDEVDAYPPSADDEGDPVALAEARTRTFSWRRKVFLASTPTIKGLSRIEREYEASDQRRFFVPCPHCGERQYLKFERLRWEKGKAGDGGLSLRGLRAADRRASQDADAERRASGGRRRSRPITLSIGFHLSSLYSPVGWLSWERIAREWEASQTSDEAKRSFINTVLGETWVETGEAPDWQRLYDRRDDYRIGTVPLGGLFLTAGADVQKDRIEVSVWAWGRGLESWLIDHIVIPGSSAGTGGPGDAGTWARLSALLGETWPHAGGSEIGLGRLAIDTGYEAPAVYGWVRRMGSGQVVAVKGVDGFSRAAPVSGPSYVDATEGGRKIRRGAKLWTIAVATFKSEAYRFLRLDKPADDGAAACPAGTVHLPRGIDAEWVKQLVAEQLVTVKTRRGFTRLEWQKLGNATRRSTAGSMPAPPPGSPASTAGPSASGGIWRSSWGSRRKRRHPPRCRRSPNKRRAPIHRRVGAPCGPAGWEDGRGTGCSDNNQRSIMSWTQAELDALKKSVWFRDLAGELRRPLGRVRFAAEDLLQRIRTIESEMAVAEGRPKPRRSLATFRKG